MGSRDTNDEDEIADRCSLRHVCRALNSRNALIGKQVGNIYH